MFDRPTILMCRPDFYGIEYEINPWMSRSRQSDSALAKQQWQSLHALLRSLRADVRLQEPVKGLPDLVFTANAGMIWEETAFLSRFRHEARQGETPHDEGWFQANGFETVTLPEDLCFEGAGDALFCGKTLYAGYIIRSDARAAQWVAGEMGCRAIPLQLVDEHYYHLDTCFCPLCPGEAIWYPPAFDEYGQAAVREHIEELIAVAPEEAARFACNAVVLGTDVVLNTGCPQLETALSERGYTPHATELGEFIKAGGSAKCLTLRLDGEDAADWAVAD
ncbi:MAG: dimethylarginine dimethylaminohydrolase family protein [Planctomycetaceae bacterium]